MKSVEHNEPAVVLSIMKLEPYRSYLKLNVLILKYFDIKGKKETRF
jgi:hypothetical protein